jgi:hypothetical protein
MWETVEQEKSQATTTQETTTTTTQQQSNHLVGKLLGRCNYLPTYLFACFAALIDGEEEETKPAGAGVGG